MGIYKAKRARAAAPRRPAACVACAAAPVNWLGEAEGVVEAEPLAAPVADAALDMALLRALLMLLAADSRADEASETTEEADEAAEEAAEAAAEVAELATDEAAEEVSGISRGTPASWQVFSTAAMVVAWSSAEQAPWTQGWTVARSSVPFLQWQAKSVKVEQPSLVRGPMKQFNCCTLIGESREIVVWG